MFSVPEFGDFFQVSEYVTHEIAALKNAHMAFITWGKLFCLFVDFFQEKEIEQELQSKILKKKNIIDVLRQDQIKFN